MKETKMTSFLWDDNIVKYVSQKQLRNAFLLLENKYEKSVKNTVSRLVNNENIAEKITKQTFYVVLNKMENCSVQSGYSRAIFKTCIELVMDYKIEREKLKKQLLQELI